MHRKITIAILLLLASCAKKAPVDQARMTDVMTDVMLLESGHGVKYNYGLLPDRIWQRDYAFVLKNHGMDTATFRLAVEWYQQHPDEYSRVMEKVITRLQKQQVKRQSEAP